MDDIRAIIERVIAEIEIGKSDEEIFQSLRPLLGKDRQTDEEIADSLVSIPHATTGRVLLRFLEVSEDKKVQKVIKRSLYRLKTRGIGVGEASFPRGISVLRPPTMEPMEGFGSPIDSSGRRLLLLVNPRGGRGLAVIQGVVGDTHGMEDIAGQEMNRRGFRSFFKELKEKNPFPLVEMEAPYVAFLFSKACQINIAKDKALPRNYPSLKREIESAKGEYEKPLIYSHLRVEEITGDDRTLGRGGDLLKADLFSGWFIGEDEIRPYADAVWEAEESKIVMAPAQKEGRFHEIYLKALSGLFSEERRLLYKGRLEEMAYVLFKLGREDEARVCLATAIDLESPVNPLQPNPFLFQLVVKSIFTLLAEAYEKKKKEPSFIVKP